MAVCWWGCMGREIIGEVLTTSLGAVWGWRRGGRGIGIAYRPLSGSPPVAADSSCPCYAGPLLLWGTRYLSMGLVVGSDDIRMG